jgi:hypothetical protein
VLQGTQTPSFDSPQIWNWKEIYNFVRSKIIDADVSWPGSVDGIKSEHMAAIEKATNEFCNQLLQLGADKVAALGVNREDLEALAEGRPVPSSIMDVILKWIARQTGSSFLDTAGLEDMSKPVPLESATPIAWQGTQSARRAAFVSTTIGRQLIGKNGKLSSTVSASAIDGLRELKPQIIVVVKAHDESPVDGVCVSGLTSQSRQIQIRQLTATKPDGKALGKALSAAGLKSRTQRFHYITGLSGEENDWFVLAKVVTQIGGASGSGTASSETLSKILHFLLVYLITNVCLASPAANADPTQSMSDGSQGGKHENGSPGNNNNGKEGGGTGSKGGGGSDNGGDKGSLLGGGGGNGGKMQGRSRQTLAASDVSHVTAPRMIATMMCRQNASSSLSNTENLDPQSGRQVAGSQMDLEATELDEESNLWKADRDSLLAAAESAYREQGGKWSKVRAAIIDEILLHYQLEDCSIHSLLSATVGRGGVLTVLCQYNGENAYVVGNLGIMNPGGRFELWISDLRKKGRWKNDAVLRHAVNWLSFHGRTKHSPAIRALVAPPLRLLKRGAFMGFASLDGPRQKNQSLGSTFLAVKHVEVQYQASIRSDMSKRVDSGALVLTDDFRRGAQILEHAVANCNRYGLALGKAAIDDVRMDEEGNPVFRNLSGSCTFPAENTPPMSHQAAKNPSFLHRANTSRSWTDDPVKGKAGQAVTLHHLDDPTVLETMDKQKGQGYSNLNDATDTLLASAEKDFANAKGETAKAKKDEAQEKTAAYCCDQRSLALMVANALCDPINSQVPSKFDGLRDDLLGFSTETAILRKMVKEGSTHARSKTQEAARIAGIKQSKTQQLEAKFRSGLEMAGISFADESLAKCASWVLESFDSQLSIKSSSSAANPATGLAYHEFLTTYTFTRDQMVALRNEGILIGPCVVARGEYMPAECKFVGKSLPAVLARIQSGKGTGLEAGQELSDGELIGFYDGPCVRAAEDVPSSRMVLRLTAPKYEHWAYCIGEEDFEKCKAIHALFSYANAPGQEEVVNCRVERNEEYRYTVGGKARVRVPVYAIGHVPDGTPLYWDYSPTAGPGMCI